MDNPIAGGNIGSDDFGHEINIPRIPSPLLKDAIDAFAGATDGTTVFVVTHFQQMLAAQVGREDFLVYDDMEQQQIHQDGIIRHDDIQGPLRKGFEGSICRCKDSPYTMINIFIVFNVTWNSYMIYWLNFNSLYYFNIT